MTDSPKIAVITGAASGIGLALAEVCINKGMKVVMADIAKQSLFAQKEKLGKLPNTQVLCIPCDVTSMAQVKDLAKQTIEKYGKIDWLFNNAGVSGFPAPIWELSTEIIEKIVNVNIYGTINGIKAFLPYMFTQPFRSHIINMASIYSLCSSSQLGAYAMSKHAILALTESLYFDLMTYDKNIDVSLVCPSFTNTSLLANSAPDFSSKLYSLMSQLFAYGRFTTDLALYIIKEVEKKTFYIFPDKEVMSYSQNRMQGILEQTKPSLHPLEKIVQSLCKKVSVNEIEKIR